jgi:hypothetical protein
VVVAANERRLGFCDLASKETIMDREQSHVDAIAGSPGGGRRWHAVLKHSNVSSRKIGSGGSDEGWYGSNGIGTEHRDRISSSHGKILI